LFQSWSFRVSARPALYGDEDRAAAAARRAAEQRFRDSAQGMLEMARELRSRASQMADSNDGNMMLRLAAEYERRATGKLSR
jgi:hypothetical protein